MSIFNSPPPAVGSRAGLFARSASHSQNASSCEGQLPRLRRDCQQMGWKVAGEFMDEGVSARSTGEGTGYRGLRVGAEAGLFDVICVLSLDRLSRNPLETREAANTFLNFNTVIYAHDRGIVSGLQRALFAEMAQTLQASNASRSARGRFATAVRRKIIENIPAASSGTDARGAPDRTGGGV